MLNHGRGSFFHLPRSSRTFGNRVDHFLHVQSGFHAEIVAFREALNETGDTNLINHLGQLSGTETANQRHLPGITINDRLDFIEVGLANAAHHRQHTVLRTGLTTRNRRINEASTCFAGASVELACDIRGRGSIVDENCPPAHARKRAFVTKHDAAQILLRWSAIGYPIAPYPMNATFAISFLPLEYVLIRCREVIVDVLPGLLRRRTQQPPHP